MAQAPRKGSPPPRPRRYFRAAEIRCPVSYTHLMRLVRLQIVEGRPDSGVQDKNDKTTERQVKIPAVRGQIYDCNGKLLVANKYTYNMYLDYDAMPYTRAVSYTHLDVYKRQGKSSAVICSFVVCRQ